METTQKYMGCLLESFSKTYLEQKSDFWDCVILSAADEEQKDCFERQLKDLFRRGKIPQTTQYFVISDCSGIALGSGGSTFHILKELKIKFGEELYKKKIWISHAGGFSKRLPNLSCIGKLFCPLPLEVEGQALTLLQLKLIITSPFLQFMSDGGTFICASDDIETFMLTGIESLLEEVKKLSENELIALAHPSSISVGTTHGVYVLPTSTGNVENCMLSSCLEVLQKPNYFMMESKGALRTSGDGEEYVYTDSMFWCRPGLVRKLMDFAHEHDDLYRIETCIYGDFLACMGIRSVEEKWYSKSLPLGSTVKQIIANTFGATPIKILVLQQSKFYHLGTMPEYLENLNPASELFRTLNMKTFVQSMCHNSRGLQGVVSTSVLQAEVVSMENSIMDSCIISVPVICEPRTIVSHCVIDDPNVKTIPAGWMFHTAAIKQNHSVRYITIAFLVNDDLKGTIEQSNGWKSTTLDSASCTLWQARLFEAYDTMDKSFAETWKKVINFSSNHKQEPMDHVTRFSMQDIVKLKHIPSMMEHMDNIRQMIKVI